jgi:hypothetical protein
MAIGFDNFNGGAKKSEVTYMKMADGDSTFRILPRSFLPSYTYWVVGASGKELPFECLQFDRESERFDNSRPCPIKALSLKDKTGKDLRCSWSYKCLVLNKATGKVEVLQMKKGIIEDIKSVAAQLEIDPTNVDTGTWFTVTRKKTGPLPMNVEYTLQQLKCRSTALTPEEKQLVADSKSIDEMFPVETYDQQMVRLKAHLEGKKDQESSEKLDEAAQEAISDLED